MLKLFFIILLFCGIQVIHNTQTAYKFIHDFGRLDSVDKKYVPVANCKFAKFNRTSGALSCNFTINFDVTPENDVSVHVKTFQFYSNEYRPSIIEFTLSACNVLKMTSNQFDIPSILKYSNIPKCPIKKGSYYAKNIIPDAKEFPPHIPPGKWRIDLHFLYKKIELAVLQWMVTVQKN